MNGIEPNDQVEIVLAGRTRRLRFTTNALVKLERELGIKSPEMLLRIGRGYKGVADLYDGVKAGLEGAGQYSGEEHLQRALEEVVSGEGKADVITRSLIFSTQEVRAMLWAGLLHEEPYLTLEEAGELIEQAPGDSPVEQESYCASRAVAAFFLRAVPKSQRGAMKTLLSLKPEDITRALKINGTGVASVATRSATG